MSEKEFKIGDIVEILEKGEHVCTEGMIGYTGVIIGLHDECLKGNYRDYWLVKMIKSSKKHIETKHKVYMSNEYSRWYCYPEVLRKLTKKEHDKYFLMRYRDA